MNEIYSSNRDSESPISGCVYSIEENNYIPFGKFSYHYNSTYSMRSFAYFNTFVIDSTDDLLYVWYPNKKSIVKMKINITRSTGWYNYSVQLKLVDKIFYKSNDNTINHDSNKNAALRTNECTIHDFRVYLQFGDEYQMILVNDKGIKTIHILGGNFTGQHYIFNIKTNKMIKFTDNICQIKCLQVSSRQGLNLHTDDDNKDIDNIDDKTKRCLKIGDMIDVRSSDLHVNKKNTVGGYDDERFSKFYLATIVDIKDKNTATTKDKKLLNKSSARMNQAKLEAYKLLKGIFVHYIGFESKYDDWIYIDDNNGTFCNCIGKCKSDHIVAAANSQSWINLQDYEYEYNMRQYIDFSRKVAVFHCKKLDKMVAFGADFNTNEYLKLGNMKDDPNNKVDKRIIRRAQVFDLRAYFRFTNRREQMGLLIDFYINNYKYNINDIDSNININKLNIPKDVCGVINKYVFDESCYDWLISKWKLSNVRIKDNNDHYHDDNHGSGHSRKRFSMKLKKSKKTQKMNSHDHREKVIVKANKGDGGKINNHYDIINSNCRVDGVFDFTCNFDFVLADNPCVLLIFNRDKGIFKFDCDTNVLEKISDCKIDYDYVVCSQKSKQIHLFIAHNVAHGKKSRYGCINLQDILQSTCHNSIDVNQV